MKIKGFSLLSCLLVYIVVVLFTLGGSRIGETHNSEALDGLSVSGNTFALGYPRGNGNIDVDVGGAGSGHAPITVNNNSTIAYFDLEVTVTGKEPKSETQFVHDGRMVYVVESNGFEAEAGQASGKAGLSLYGSLSYTDIDTLNTIYYVHHHEFESNYPPNDYDEDNGANLGMQSDIH
ncbi:hypothetical protein J4G08_06345 [Candidatus Poribacteria bacterium]|nr:hypothetical protein [Candidatus Poribacteria bacterium]